MPCWGAVTIKYIVYFNMNGDFMEVFHWRKILKILHIYFIEYLLTREKTCSEAWLPLYLLCEIHFIYNTWSLHSFKMQKWLWFYCYIFKIVECHNISSHKWWFHSLIFCSSLNSSSYVYCVVTLTHISKSTAKWNHLYHRTSTQISTKQNSLFNILMLVLRQLPFQTITANAMSLGSGICNTKQILLIALVLEQNNVVLRHI